MDELKAKLKNMKINPFKKKFQGTGHVLGSAQPTGAPGRGPATGSARPTQPAAAARPTQQQPPQQQQPSAFTGAPRFASSSREPQRQPPPDAAAAPAAPLIGLPVAEVATNQAPLPQQQVVQPPSLQQHAAAAAAAGTQQQDAGVARLSEQELAEQCEAVEAAVTQLSSDPHAASSGAAGVLLRLLRNVAASPGDPKFRRLRLSNPKIQQAVVEAPGGVELLLACGFEIVFGEGAGAAASGDSGAGGGAGGGAGAAGESEGFAVLDSSVDLRPLHHALQLLQPLAPPSAAAPPSPSQPALPSTASSSSSSLAAAAAQQQQTQQQQRVQSGRAGGSRQQRSWDPPRPRGTQVLLPQSPATDLPDWFFMRTGAELKTAFLTAARKREQEQVLMTRAMRERQRAAAAGPAATYCLLRVRLPEGIFLQGEFNPGEPVAAVFAWVASCLHDPMSTYELVTPSRTPLLEAGQAVRDADLMPSATLNLRWTGQSAVEMKTTPALRDDMLRAAHAAEQGW